MSRALLLVALLFAGPCFAAGFDLDAFYGKWLAAETSHLDGLSLLDDDVLIDNLEPLAGDCHAAQAEAPKDWRAAALLGLGYHFALCGAPEDDGIARNYLLRAWRHGPPEAGYFIAYYALDPSFFHDDPFLRHNEKRMCLRMQSVPDQLLTAAEKGFAPAQGVAGHLLLELREDNGKAQGWLKAAAEADCRPAQLWRAWWLYEGGLHEDALKQLQALDKLGDPAGAYALAFVHDPMFGKIEPDLKVARKQYQRALELGNYAAQWRLNDLPEIAQEDLKPEDIPAIYRRGWVEGNIERKQADLGNLAESYYACPPNRMLDWYPDIGNWLEQRIAPEVKAKDEADCYLYLAYAEMIAYRNWPAWDDDDLPIFPSDLVAKIDTDLCPEALIRAMEWTADRIQDDDFLQNLERAQLTKLPTAKRWYAMALLDGHLSKWLYFRNPDRYEQDDDMAVNILRTLAKEGDALSAIVLAEETRDAEVKFKWYEQAAKLGNPGAALFCARARMKGEGTQKDFAKAGTWLSVVAAYSADYAVTAASDMREMHRLSRRPGALEECAKLGKAAVESLNKQAGFDE
ncbi:MAG: sel1 repeat family protein, partial [Planctomycetes bacterium]|nr:sel1 repeat family protein [Planctomycetota bacterium]